MHLISKLKGYFVSSAFSLGRLTYSAGQTFYAVKEASNYIFKDTVPSPVKLVLPCIAMAGGLGVNLIIRVPSIFKKFAAQTEDIKNEESSTDDYKLGYLGSFFNYLFHATGHATAFFNALNAHFGTVILSESIAEILNSDAHDPLWKEAVIQTAAVFVAITALATYYSYDYKILKENSRKIAEKIDQHDFSFDKNSAKTLAVSALNLIASPILAKFWTSPAIIKIPNAEKYLTKIGINCITWSASVAAFINGLTTLPSTYAYFSKSKIKEYTDTSLTKAIRYATYISAGIDSLASGLCTYIGIVNTAKVSLNMNPYGYVISFAAPTGTSAAIQNAMLIRPGYIDLVQSLNADDLEAQPFLSHQENIDYVEDEPITITLNQDNLITEIERLPVNSDKDEIVSQPSYFRDNSTVGLMFNTHRSDINSSGDACKTEYQKQEITEEPIESVYKICV